MCQTSTVFHVKINHLRVRCLLTIRLIRIKEVRCYSIIRNLLFRIKETKYADDSVTINWLTNLKTKPSLFSVIRELAWQLKLALRKLPFFFDIRIR